MFCSVLACRLILDLRERGYEITQPTIVAPHIVSRSTDSSKMTASTYDSSAGHYNSKHPGSVPRAYGAATVRYSASGKTLKALINSGNGGGGGGAGRTQVSTIGIDPSLLSARSHAHALFGLEGDSEHEHERLGVSGGGVELRSFTPRLDDDDDEKPDVEAMVGMGSGLGDDVPAYHYLDVPAQTPPPTQAGRPSTGAAGIRVDVQRTTV